MKGRSKAEGSLSFLKVEHFKGSKKFVAPAMFCIAGAFFMGYYCLRIYGFTTTFSRVSYITVTNPVYRMNLEHGVSPMNIHLPPHLRMDMLSYLDLKETELVVPPLFDLSQSGAQTTLNAASDDSAGKAAFSSSETNFMGIKVNTSVTHQGIQNQAVNRRIPVSPEHAEKVRKMYENIGVFAPREPERQKQQQ